MTKGLAVAPRKTTIARPLKTLVPLIQHELQAGMTAGLEHYRRAGEMLLEAKEQMPYGSWQRWLKQHFALSQYTAQNYMRLARLEVPEHLSGSLRSALGQKADRQTHAHSSWRPVLKAARELDADLFAQERQTEANEVQVHRDLAVQLIDLGYRALATRLHPDQGGSHDAMARLHRVRDQLKSVAQTRRFV
jgi:hypothetical protein